MTFDTLIFVLQKITMNRAMFKCLLSYGEKCEAG